MAKRFTDTNLHRKPWFRALRIELRESWRILCAECDKVGIWEIDLESLNLWLGTPAKPVTIEELTAAFDLQHFDGDKFFIPGYVPFQYGDDAGRLSPANKVHLGVIKRLEALGLPLPQLKAEPGPCAGQARPVAGPKEEEEEKEEVKVKDVLEGGAGGNTPPVEGSPSEASPSGVTPAVIIEEFAGDEIAARGLLYIPENVQRSWVIAYPGLDLREEIRACVLYYTSDGTHPRLVQWGERIVAWLNRSRARGRSQGRNDGLLGAAKGGLIDYDAVKKRKQKETGK